MFFDNFDVDYIIEKKIKNWKLYIILDSIINYVLSVFLFFGKNILWYRFIEIFFFFIKLYLECFCLIDEKMKLVYWLIWIFFML